MARARGEPPRIVGFDVRQWWGCTQEDIILCAACFRHKTYAERVVRRYLTMDDAGLTCARCLHELDGSAP